jgi:lysine 2,3-aminomutase
MVGRAEVLAERPDLEESWEAVDATFSVRLTRSFADRADLADPTDPLALQVLPDPRELDADGLDDPVGEKSHSPVPWVVQKYPDRVLLLVTKRCHLYCRYCFRRTHAPGDALDPPPDALEAALDWLAEQTGIREVILSGGDPLILRDGPLFALIDRLQSLDLRVRLHTRAPITFPSRVTPELAMGLARRAVFTIVHCNHPRELAEDVRAALACLVDHGVPVLDQTVLLAGVNDDPTVLVELFEALVRLRVRPYYLHHTDAVRGNAHFRVSLDRGRAIYAAVRDRLGGIAIPRYVVDPPSGEGKREVSPAPEGEV